MGPACSTELDCCEGQGVCIYGACYQDDGSGITCSMLGETCDDFAGSPCCFSASCACADAGCTTRVCADITASGDPVSSESPASTR
jgi:hypothetical protein